MNQIFQSSPPESHKIPLWERILQLFLILGTAFYALWQFGIKRLIWEKNNGDLRPLIIIVIIATLIVFGYFMILIYSNHRKINAGLTQLNPIQRYLGYLKIVFIWIAIIILGIIIK